MNNNYLAVTKLNGALTLQDLGRASTQHLGFSVSGAADEYAFLSANKLLAVDAVNAKNGLITPNSHGLPVSEPLNHGAIELTFGQATFTTSANCVIAITGADCAATINDRAINNWQAHALMKGDSLVFSRPLSGVHSYLAVQGGLSLASSSALWLGSHAQTLNEMPLAFSGDKILAGSKVYFPNVQQMYQPEESHLVTTLAENFYAKKQLTLRFMPSTLFQQLTVEQQALFLTKHYTISAQSNRMGYRLIPNNVRSEQANSAIISAQLRQHVTLSAPVTYGAIQMPANEQPIVLMKERQTMGGYPTLGYVMKTDLFRLSQMRPGDAIAFVTTTLQKSQQQLTAFYKKFSRC